MDDTTTPGIQPALTLHELIDQTLRLEQYAGSIKDFGGNGSTLKLIADLQDGQQPITVMIMKTPEYDRAAVSSGDEAIDYVSSGEFTYRLQHANQLVGVDAVLADPATEVVEPQEMLELDAMLSRTDFVVDREWSEGHTG